MRRPRTSLLAWTVALLCNAPAAAAPTHPNLVLLLADDLGWNDVGYHGSEIRTPHIDALAARGVALDRFYAFPTCTPTRVALMTGRSPLAMGLHGPLEPARDGLPVQERTLADVLRAAGYQTWLVGKWHLGAGHVKYWPRARGFDEFYGHLTGGIGYWDKVHDGGYDWMRGESVVREGGYTTDLIAGEAVRLLRERDASRPAFLCASFNAPHVPNEAPAEAVARHPEIADPARRTHAAMVELLDAAIGRILATLEDEGMARDTLVIFLSDNGGATRESVRGWVRWLVPQLDEFASSNAPLRGGKSDVFEGGIRVPAIWHWPGRLEGGRTISGRVTVQDVLPTLGEALALPVDDGRELHGSSRWDVIADGADTPAPDFAVGSIGSFAYFRGPWKLVEAASPLPFAKTSGTFLFRVDEDPNETRDLAASHPEIVAELKTALSEFPVAESTFVLPKPWDYDTLFGGAETRPPWAESAERP